MSNFKITLVPPDLNKVEGKIVQKPTKFKVPLEDNILQMEMFRKLTVECGKKCIDYEHS